MRADCHMHMILDGENWKSAIMRHSQAPDETWIREILSRYQELGFTYLRDGGDRWGAGKRARELAPEYGIVYRTPLAPLCRAGRYGGFIGEKYEDFREFRELVKSIRRDGGDFIKIMISGLMDFDHFGVLTEPGYTAEEIRELINIAHGEGFSVMAHANGADVVKAAAEAGVDSVEHGAYLNEAALQAMAEHQVVWVPTLSTVGNLRGTGRFSEPDVKRILASAMENVARFSQIGGVLAPGTDAGAWAVPHGSLSEFELLKEVLGEHADSVLENGVKEIQRRF